MNAKVKVLAIMNGYKDSCVNKKKIIKSNESYLVKPIPLIQKEKLPATWLVRRFSLIKWPAHHCGLLISIVKRTEFVDQFGLAVGDYRDIIKLNLPFLTYKTFKVKILKIGKSLYKNIK